MIRIIIPTVTPPIRPALDPSLLSPKLLSSLGDSIPLLVMIMFWWPEVLGKAFVCLVVILDVVVSAVN